MFKKLLRDNRGDMYLEWIIGTVVLLFIIGMFVCVVSSMNIRTNIEDGLDDIATIIQTTGSIEGSYISTIADSLIEKYGGKITFVGSVVDEDKGYVQLNDVVYVVYTHDEVAFFSMGGIQFTSDIRLTSMARSGIYWKDYDDTGTETTVVYGES